MLPHHTKITKYLFVLFIILILGYAYISSRNLLWGPQIIINGPQDGISVETELVEITGAVKNVIDITLSGRSVFITEEGVFTERLLLSEGINRFVFEARDKFGRETREILQIVYDPKEQTTPVQEDASIEENKE